jgi:dolichol-phosphate mannosyltransferase
MAMAIAGLGYRVLIIDDNSPDGTGIIAERLAAISPAISVIHRPEKDGLGRAYAAGFDVAHAMGAGIICQIDCDFSHDPNDLPRLIEQVAGGADVAIGSRYIPGGSVPDWSLSRRVLSIGGNWYTRLMLGMVVRDATAGFRAYRAAALLGLSPADCSASGYGFQVEMTYRATRSGMTVVEVPITFRDRTEGTSKMDHSIAVEAMALVTRWGLQEIVRRGYEAFCGVRGGH